MAPLVSAIIPVYNVERYVGQCLDSILSQTLSNIEVICVNDGSTDASPSIMRDYAACDSRVKVIEKENEGYGRAVNVGIENATGQWIAIVEPDDFIDEHMFEELLDAAQLEDGRCADIVKSSYWMYYDYEGVEPYIKVPNLGKCMPGYRCGIDLDESAEIVRHHPSIWSALYKRDFLERNSIRMVEAPGAGWTDNPWLYDTMLRAETIAWTPQAYYYYRQTNPGSSMNLTDYRIGFDRLRDDRRIFDELGVTGEKLLTALYAREMFYVVSTVLESGAFDQSDPELRALIQEVLESIDADILLRPDNGISSASKDYYRDFMGHRLEKVGIMPRSSAPIISLVIPVKDDERGLWSTMIGLLKQDFRDFEMLFVDCGSHDRSAETIRSVAERDARIRLLSEPSGNVGNGFNLGLREAQGAYIGFLRSGVVLTQKNYLSQIHEGIRMAQAGRHANAVVVGEREHAFLAADQLAAPPSAIAVPCAGQPEFVASNASPLVYGKFFERAVLEEAQAIFSDVGDDDGCAFQVRALCGAGMAVFVNNLQARTRIRDRMVQKAYERNGRAIESSRQTYHAIAAAAEDAHTDSAWRVARALLLRVMLRDLDEMVYEECGSDFYDMVRTFFSEEYDLAQMPASYYKNYRDYNELVELKGTPFESFVSSKAKADRSGRQTTSVRLVKLGDRNERLSCKNESLKKRCAKLQRDNDKLLKSREYRYGSKIVRAAKKVPGARRMVRGAAPKNHSADNAAEGE